MTQEIAYAYRDKAKALLDNGQQDIGERRALRMELQERCGVTELEAVNIINGFHIKEYCRKYLAEEREAAGLELLAPIIPLKQPRKEKRRRYEQD